MRLRLTLPTRSFQASRLAVASLALFCLLPVFAQQHRRPPSSDEIRFRLEKVRTVGRVLMIAAHPDDENTNFLAYCARGRKLKTAYLSLTRGEGGQNLIGSEQGPYMGVIRTQELLAARRIDGAEQMFSRAIDFGFSKSADECLKSWGKQDVLSDVVWVIRKFRPDVIVLRFSGTPRDGHGMHQASALLGKEAFRAAADPQQFPEQLKWVQPWQAKRIYWNAFSFNREQEQELAKEGGLVKIDLGAFDPLSGYSFGELAGLSRSQHRSQGMGAEERRGSVPNYFKLVDGTPGQSDLFDGVDLTWNRISGGAAVNAALEHAQAAFDPDHPDRLLPSLLEARKLIAGLKEEDAQEKLNELDELIAMSAGLWLDFSTSTPEATPGTSVNVSMNAVSRLCPEVRIDAVKLAGVAGAPALLTTAQTLEVNKPFTREVAVSLPKDQEYTQPFWLKLPAKGNLYTLPSLQDVGMAEAPTQLVAKAQINVKGSDIALECPVRYRYVDRVRGEMQRPFVVLPPVSLRLSHSTLVFPSPEPQTVRVTVHAQKGAVAGNTTLQVPDGWKVEPTTAPFHLNERGQEIALAFQVTPVKGESSGRIKATASMDGVNVASDVVRIGYEHIPPQTIMPPAEAKALREDVRISAKRVGYVMGAGDDVPSALEQLGCDVTLLSSSDLAMGDLSRFDAIVTGVRAWNVREDLIANYERLWDYAKQGGTVVVQYNVWDPRFGGNDAVSSLKNIGPWPITLSRDRVAVEDVPVEMLSAQHPLLNSPNKIVSHDFDGWVQERGLYFPTKWDSRYETLLSMHDPDEPALKGAILYTRVGKGTYVLTTLSWFRQLPAGVPGAYKIFANLVSGGKP